MHTVAVAAIRPLAVLGITTALSAVAVTTAISLVLRLSLAS
jgi:hypothetical protein